jgi:Spy/CpxP family protein refolding chaperone
VELVEEALQGIDLRPDQSDALKKLGDEVNTKVDSVEEARRGFLLALADQIESGKVDATALHPQIEKVVDAAKAASPDLRSAFEKLHDVLDPQQRRQFVDNFRASMKKHAADIDPKAQMERWAKTLDLTDDQKEKIGGIVGKDTVANDVARARIELILAAFPGDQFSWNDLVPESAVPSRTERMLTRMADVCSQVTAILTPDQRKLSAKAIRDKVAKSRGQETTKTTTSDLEAVGSTSQAFWAGGGFGGGYATGYAHSSGYAFSSGFGAGYGGTFLF